MTGPIAILRFTETEISTSDPLAVQSLWRLMAVSISPEERQAVDGRTEFREPPRPPVHLTAIKGG